MTEKDASVLRFNDCELDTASRELRRAGEIVALEPKVFALLVYLYEQRHRAVGKDEIQDVVWEGVIVSETALTRAIMKARRAVSDSPDKQAVIRTVHGHGYQFVATSADEPDQTEIARSEPDQRRRTYRSFVLLAMTIVVVAAVVFFLWPKTAPQQSIRLAIMPVENASNDADYEWTRLGLMGFASDLVARNAELNTLPTSDVIRFTERNALSYDKEGAAADLEKLQAMYGASHMVQTRLEKNAGTLRLTYSLYGRGGDVEVGTMVGAEPTELMRGMVRSVTATLDRSVRTVDEITVVSEDPFINEAYSRGLGFALEGRCAEAQQFFVLVTANGNSDGRADYEWANCARILGRWQEAEAAFKKILDGIPAEPASSLRAGVLNGLGTVYIRTGRGDEARETFLLGLSEAENAGDLFLQGRLLNSLAIEAKDRREFGEARALIGRAMLSHSEADAGELPGQLPAALANIDMAEGKFDQADQHLQDALSAFRALGDRRNEAMMLNNTGYLRRLQGRFRDAEPLHLQSLEIRQEIGDLVGQGRTLGMLSIIFVDDGRLDEARDAAAEALRIANVANDKLFMATSWAQLAKVDQSAGNLVEARRGYVESNALFLAIDDYSRAAQTTIRIARLDLKTGDYEAAKTSADAVRKLAIREALHEPAIEAMVLNADIARTESDLPEAISAYHDALDYIDQSGFVASKTAVIVKLANTLLDQGDLDRIEPLIGYLIEQGSAAESLRLRARRAFVSGDAAKSVELLESIQALTEGSWSEADAQTLLQYREETR